MTAERYVVVGLAHVRSPWFVEVARWATAGALPIEFVKCVSVEELRARVAGGRPFSAALLDGRLPAVDRDLLATLRDVGIPPLVVAGDDPRDWTELGAAARLAEPLGRAELADALAAHGRLLGAVDADPDDTPRPTTSTAWRGRLVAVTGRSGAGTSTVAAALAQDLADDPRYAADVVLVDLARHAHQALLHDARDVVPGIQELVEAHRSGRPAPDLLPGLSFEVVDRGYRLVLGLRHARDWVTIRSRAFEAALDGMRRAARIVVADVDPDLEGEAETGSFDVEDRNVMARATAAAADLVVVVGRPDSTGIHGLVGQVADLHAHGVPPDRILTVLNRAPRRGRAQAELSRTVSGLVELAGTPMPHLGPAFVGERRHVDHLHRDLGRFPSALAGPPGRAVRTLLDRLPIRHPERGGETGGSVVAPGSLGHWDDDADGPEAVTP